MVASLRSVPWFQLVLLVVLWAAGEAVARGFGLPVPGAVFGIAFALVLLLADVLPLARIKRGADWLIAQNLLFFVPAVLAVLDHRELFGVLGLKVLAIIVAGTAAVMVVTAVVVDFAARERDE